MIILFVTDVSFFVRFVLTVLNLGNSAHTVLQESRPNHSLIEIPGQSNLLLVERDAQTAPQQQQLVLQVADISVAKSAAVAVGIEVVDEFVSRYGELCLLQGEVEFVLIQEYVQQAQVQVQAQETQEIPGTEDVYRDDSVPTVPSEASAPPPLNATALVYMQWAALRAEEGGTGTTVSASTSVDGDRDRDEGNRDRDRDRGRRALNAEKAEKEKASEASHEMLKAQAEEQWLPPLGTRLPLIRPLLLHDGQMRPITANAIAAVPFTTDLFQGRLLLLVNSPLEQQPLLKDIFQNGGYRFELQVQGRFLKVPPGPLFIGAEITQKMELGLLTRGLCASFLQLARSTNPNMHHSFGDRNDTELPHIVGPFWSAADRLVVTPEGENPPPFVTSFPEPQTSRLARKAKPDYSIPVDLDSTYSFSFKTTKMDLEAWAVVNVPMMRPIDLGTFWGDADLRMVGYCLPPHPHPEMEFSSTTPPMPKKHPQALQQHVFKVEVRHANNHQWETGAVAVAGTGVEGVEGCVGIEVDITVGGGGVGLSPGSPSGQEEEDDDDFHDAVEGLETGDGAGGGLGSGLAALGLGLGLGAALAYGGDVEEEDGEEEEDGSSLPSVSWMERDWDGEPGNHTVGGDTGDTGSTGSIGDTGDTGDMGGGMGTGRGGRGGMSRGKSGESRGEGGGDNLRSFSGVGVCLRTVDAALSLRRRLVVAAVDCNVPGKSKRRTLYAFLANPDSASTASASALAAALAPGLDQNSQVPPLQDRYVLRSYGEWKACLPVRQSPPPQLPAYTRMGEEARRRTQLTRSYEALLRASAPSAPTPLSTPTTFAPASPAATARASLARFLSNTGSTEGILTDTGVGVGAKRQRLGLPPFLSEALVLVQTGNHHWSEECIGLGVEELVFIKPTKLLGLNRLRIPLNDILHVHAVTEVDNPLPLPHLHALVITTFARQYTVLLRGQTTRDEWVAALGDGDIDDYERTSSVALTSPAFDNLMGPLVEVCICVGACVCGCDGGRGGRGSGGDGGVRSGTGPQVPGPRTSITWEGPASLPFLSFSFSSALTGMVSYPANWALGDRMVLNCRNFTAHGDGGAYHLLNERSRELALLSPGPLVARLLQMAFSLSVHYSEEKGVGLEAISELEMQQLWVDFMDGVSLLQGMDLDLDPTSPEALCMFLNLYHCMLLHAYMVVGLPNSLFRWSAFFRNCTYEIFGDIVSLAEMEHCVLRAGMARPGLNFIAQLFIPQADFSFALQVQDYRLLWGIFCGATSSVTRVPVYSPPRLHDQLQRVVAAALEAEVRVQEHRVTLPLMCKMYAKEFVPSPSTGTYTSLSPRNGSFSSPKGSSATRDVLLALLPHLRDPLRSRVEALASRGGYSVKYTSLDFRCKYPIQVREKEP